MKNIKTYELFERELKKARKSTFTIDGEESFEGWTFDDEWNGFACPYFEKEAADKVAKYCNGKFDGKDTYSFDEEREEPEVYTSQMIETVEGKKKVWPIGAWMWTWSE